MADLPALASAPPSWTRLSSHLKQYNSAIVALSGGVDSTLLALVTHRVLPKGSVHAVTGVSSSLPSKSLEQIKVFCNSHGITLHTVKTYELSNKNYIKNSPDRCFHCKEELYSKLQEKASELGVQVVLDGTHPGDLQGHRPGHKAALNLNVKSPFIDTGISKSEIRAMAEHLGLNNATSPSSPCLSSRVAYGVPVTPERLLRIERSEAVLHELGFPKVRVRLHGPTARIEVPAADISRLAQLHKKISHELRKIGFTYVTLDLEGYRSGSLLKIIDKRP